MTEDKSELVWVQSNMPSPHYIHILISLYKHTILLTYTGSWLLLGGKKGKVMWIGTQHWRAWRPYWCKFKIKKEGTEPSSTGFKPMP